MRLIKALQNLRSLMARISPRHWGEDEGGADAEPVRCTHVLSRQFVVNGTTGQLKRNKDGDLIEHVRRCKLMAPVGFEVCHLHGGPSGIKAAGKGGGIPDPMRLVRLCADINREIDALTPRPRRVFDLLYRKPLPLGTMTLRDWHDGGHHDAYTFAVMRQTGYDEPGVFWSEHDDLVAAIELKLIDNFPEARHAA